MKFVVLDEVVTGDVRDGGMTPPSFESSIKRTVRTHSEDGQRCLELGILVDKDDLINYQLVVNYRLLIRILTNQPNVDKVIVLSSNC